MCIFLVYKQTSPSIESTTPCLPNNAVISPLLFPSTMQASRDYEAFFKASAWGATDGVSFKHKPDKPEKPEKPDVKPERPDRPDRPSRPERPKKPHKPEKPDTAEVTNSDDWLSRQRPQLMFPPSDTVPPPRDVRSKCTHVDVCICCYRLQPDTRVYVWDLI